MCIISKRFFNTSMFFIFFIVLAVCDAKTTVSGKDVNYFFSDPNVVELIQAAENGDIVTIKSLAALGENFNAIGKEGFTPLMWSFLSKNYIGIDALLKYGADPNLISIRDGSAVAFMSGGNDNKILEILLRHKGDPDKYGHRGDTPLIIAIKQRRWKNMRLLIQYGADINKKNIHDSYTPAMLAASRGKYEQVFYLLAQGADYQVSNRYGFKLGHRLHSAIGDDNPWKKKVQMFLEDKGVTFPLPRPDFTGSKK